MSKKYLDATGVTHLWQKITDYAQSKLVSGTNIKTVNGNSLLGSGNITIDGGGSSEERINLEVNAATGVITITDTTYTTEQAVYNAAAAAWTANTDLYFVADIPLANQIFQMQLCDKQINSNSTYYKFEAAFGETNISAYVKYDGSSNYSIGFKMYELLTTKNAVDYVVAQGTSNSWTYREWNSGFYECWKTVFAYNLSASDWTHIAATSTSSDFYRIQFADSKFALPVTFADTNYKLQVQSIYNEQLWTFGVGKTTSTFGFTIGRWDSLGSATLGFDVYAAGYVSD